jgi:hypothetical protein
MTKLTRGTVCPAAQLAVHHYSRANASANCHHDSVHGTSCSPSSMLREGGASRIVIGRDWQSDSLREEVLNGDILQGQMS